MTSVISREFFGYGQALADTRAHIQQAGIPTPRQFSKFYQLFGYASSLPQSAGIAFAQKIEKGEVGNLEKKMRDFGYPDFKFWPEGEGLCTPRFPWCNRRTGAIGKS